MKTKTRFILTVVVPICLSVMTAIVVVILNSKSILHTRAEAIVEYEKKEIDDNIRDLKNEKKQLERKEAECDKLIKKNELLQSEIDALKKSIEDYDADIARAVKKDTELDKTIEQKQAYLEGLSGISPDTAGGTYKLSDGDYKCPADIPAGKYLAKGTGKLYIKDIANRRKDKADLSTIESNTYTFEIVAGESLTAEG